MQVQILHTKDGLGMRIYNVWKYGLYRIKRLEVEDCVHKVDMYNHDIFIWMIKVDVVWAVFDWVWWSCLADQHILL